MRNSARNAPVMRQHSFSFSSASRFVAPSQFKAIHPPAWQMCGSWNRHEVDGVSCVSFVPFLRWLLFSNSPLALGA